MNATEHRCIAEGKRGRCRVTRGLNAAGLCPMHAGTTDPRALGKLSGAARRKPNRDRVHPGLREYLRAEVHPERIWGALETAMTGANESARVSASKVLLDALAEPAGGCPDCAARAAAAPDVEARVLDLLSRGQPERRQRQRRLVHEELAPVAEFDAALAARVEARLCERLA